MRKNIFDVLNEVDIQRELLNIDELIGEAEVADSLIEDFFDEVILPDWKQRNRYRSCREIREKLAIESKNIYRGLNEKKTLLFLEYAKNIICLCKECYAEMNVGEEVNQGYVYLVEHVDFLIGYLNFETKIFFEEEKVILVEKNPSATAVAEIVESKLAEEIIEYNHFLLKGDIDKKRIILLALADKFEPIRKDLSKVNKELESNVGYLLNKMNIRHNNIEGNNAIEYVKNLSQEELEEWYDETYQMLLLSILTYDNIVRGVKVADLKKQIEG